MRWVLNWFILFKWMPTSPKTMYWTLFTLCMCQTPTSVFNFAVLHSKICQSISLPGPTVLIKLLRTWEQPLNASNWMKANDTFLFFPFRTPPRTQITWGLALLPWWQKEYQKITMSHLSYRFEIISSFCECFLTVDNCPSFSSSNMPEGINFKLGGTSCFSFLGLHITGGMQTARVDF